MELNSHGSDELHCLSSEQGCDVAFPSGQLQALISENRENEPVFHGGARPVSVIDVSELVDVSQEIEVERIDTSDWPNDRGYRFVKRLFDIVLSSLALIILALPMCTIAILIKLDSPGPVLYKQERLGKNGKPFMLMKFRSMYIDAEAGGAQWATDNDPRVTKIGKILRASRLDELPQFLQVVSGDLSLVGPRPERKVFYDEFEKYIHGFSQRLIVKPGISGLAQVSGGYDLRPAEKIMYDIEYIKNRSTLLDFRIILKTIVVVFTHDGAR
ncbi:MAG: sugar transferase [Coriobacteriia bacterium]|nr:sugar transferase [Coriobacteriia bacterium]